MARFTVLVRREDTRDPRPYVVRAKTWESAVRKAIFMASVAEKCSPQFLDAYPSSSPRVHAAELRMLADAEGGAK